MTGDRVAGDRVAGDSVAGERVAGDRGARGVVISLRRRTPKVLAGRGQIGVFS